MAVNSERVRIDGRYRFNGLTGSLLGRNELGTGQNVPNVPGAWVWSDGPAHTWSDDIPASWTDGLGEGSGEGESELAIIWEDGYPILWEDGEEIEWEV